jgi:hypothetical protein
MSEIVNVLSLKSETSTVDSTGSLLFISSVTFSGEDDVSFGAKKCKIYHVLYKLLLYE